VTSKYPSVNAGMGTVVNSIVTIPTFGQKGITSMEQENAPGGRINETPLFVTGVMNVRIFLKWLKE
jgi:hypothetical protein